VREFGVSNFSPSQFSLLQNALSFPLVVNQVEVSLLQLNALHDGTLDQCQEKQVTPLASSPSAPACWGPAAWISCPVSGITIRRPSWPSRIASPRSVA
jgi:diketogulonate reductase-like aldo/keto reductase